MRLSKKIAMCAMGWFSCAAFAQTPPPIARPDSRPGQEKIEQMKEKCAQAPAACEEMKAKHKEHMAQRRAEHKAWCEANPEPCAEKRKAMQEKRQQHRADMKAKCEAEPAACEAKKAQMHERMQQGHDHPPPADAPKPAASGT